MKETIRFKGLRLAGDEMSAQHGELSLCGGVELYDGALRPSVLDGTTQKTWDSINQKEADLQILGELLYIHATADGNRYFISRRSVEGGDVFLDYDKPRTQETAGSYSTVLYFDASGIRSIKSVGNTLVIMKEDGLHYILYKSGNYTYLGQQPPFLELQFTVVNEPGTDMDKGDWKRNKEGFDLSVAEDMWWGLGTGNNGIKESVRASITEQVMAAINKRTDTAVKEGRFYAPFMIRYCYRMYDGSMIMHSAPVLLFPMLNHPVITWIDNAVIATGGAVGQDMFTFCVYLRECTLNVRRTNLSDLSSLTDWRDIIKSVDVFVTPQFSRIDTAAMIEDIHPSSEFTVGNVAFFENSIEDNFNGIYSGYGEDKDKRASFVLPEIAEQNYFDRIRNASSFYKIKSVDIGDVSSFGTDFGDFSFDTDVLKNITVQEQMTDDYKTHNLLLPATDETGGLYVYNHRLNFYGLSENLFKGFSPACMFPGAGSGTVKTVTKVDVLVRTNAGMIKCSVDGLSVDVNEWQLQNGMCFYPDSRAVSMIFTTSSGTYNRKLSDHPMLNGARAFMNKDEAGVTDDKAEYTKVPMPNKIYTSKADNPFYFPNKVGESGINSVGAGEIIGIAAVTRPLVSGEVGKQSLVVFATDGIWVCEVSDTGTYSGMRNISREVCADSDSICQLDQSIFFATNRSLSRFVESDVVLISSVLDGPYFDTTKLGGESGLYAALQGDLKTLGDFNVSFDKYLDMGRVIYDYVSMRILVLPSNYQDADKFVAMVYSIRDGAWSTMVLPKLRAAINFYPSPYIQYSDGTVKCLDKPYDFNSAHGAAGTPENGLIVTRTLSFSDTMDVLRGFRQHHNCGKKPKLYIYGSNDEFSWNYIGHTDRDFYNYLPGHPFRYFRIAIILAMTTGEKYEQLDLEVINKYAKL